MSDALKTLSNIRSLRVIARETSLEQLESLQEKLAIVIEEKREELKNQELEQAKFLEGLNKYKEMLAQDGISAEELVALLGGQVEKKARKSIAPRPAKYKFIDANGNEKTWTGQGRTPRELVGKNLADFEI
ncbi:H-NS family nucleoid-associated regulatory protein [Actinobacillus minor]|uniref:DNA-binding protein n=1 Tax=Actinobacillus minor NM305 TaxID=637911 RepID=C5S2G9_9PAST|nr:H-NS family nucleoid-associated regulatory protein [Actinobacillus minor]EER46937.1 DNA-binding protein H-NS [Actinobacillus minor NM305]MDD6910171.1 H-NS family nucleoid-associated regulatory protein [Actinobacillus minor]MDY4713550.1 H-NS family nucleoid-associated regulatory protein [Actinobacillus minor]MDY5107526.1 H-NS family nucleoid-associated regulatory protein [Actinobacillus minor]